jgi:hypothetical protein
MHAVRWPRSTASVPERRTLLRAIKAGKMSGARDDAGVWHVEPAELFRVFEPAPEQEEGEPQHVAELRAQCPARPQRVAASPRGTPWHARFTAARCTTMPYTLAAAAAACGLDKSTVRRAVRSGKISGTKDEAGTWHVEPVELHRVFPPAPRTEDNTTAAPLHAPSDAATDILVAELRAIIRASERREEDLRQERDRWRDRAEERQDRGTGKGANVEGRDA